ncbi:hypothetical protein BJ912DRAFT_1049701 [Pholiota molesta]|nr:hypothetical protein BJ912DRAFT_1049701 [Pholiota molesta]
MSLNSVFGKHSLRILSAFSMLQAGGSDEFVVELDNRYRQISTFGNGVLAAQVPLVPLNAELSQAAPSGISSVAETSIPIPVATPNHSYSTQLGELAHRLVKRLYGLTNKKNAIQQIGKKYSRKQALHLLEQYEMSEASKGRLEDHHIISTSRNTPIDIYQFVLAILKIQQRNRLQDHLLARLLGRTFDGDTDEDFTHEDRQTIRFRNGTIFRVRTARINYTTYDVRRAYDTINPRTRPFVMVASPETQPNSHPFAQIFISLELAKTILQREKLKKEAAGSSQTVWEKRLAYVDLKRKFPSLNDKIGDELLVDKERPAKRPEVARVPGLKIRTNDQAPPTPLQAVTEGPRPSLGRILSTTPTKRFPRPMHPDSSSIPHHTLPPFLLGLVVDCPPARAVSMRVDWSRRRRILLDAVSRRITPKLPRSSLFGLPENDEDKNMDVDDPAEAERLKRLEEQWKYDADDVPPVGPEGADEQSRMLVGHYDPNYLRHTGYESCSDQYSQWCFADPQAEVNNEMSAAAVDELADAAAGVCREWHRRQMNGIHVASPNVVYAVPVRSPSGLRQMAKVAEQHKMCCSQSRSLRFIAKCAIRGGAIIRASRIVHFALFALRRQGSIAHNFRPRSVAWPSTTQRRFDTLRLRSASHARRRIEHHPSARGRRVLGCWQTISNAPRPNSNGLRGSQAAPPPTTLRKNIAAEDGDDGAHTRRSRSSPATTCGQRRQTGGQRRHHSHIENDVPTRTIYGHRSVVANETTTLGYGIGDSRRRARAGYLDDIATHPASARSSDRPEHCRWAPRRAGAMQNGPRAAVSCV